MIAGLNPYSACKPCGVEWLGDVPAHWKIMPLKRIGRFRGGTGFPIVLQGNLNEEVLFVKVSDMNKRGNHHRIVDSANTVSRQTAQELGANIFPKDAIVFPKVGGALLTNKRRLLAQKACVDNNLMACVVTQGDKDFVFRMLGWLDLGRIAKPGPIPAISEGEVREIRVALPPLPEQTAIARFLDHADRRIGRYIRAKQKLIALLEEQKQAIIHQAVTGQIDVRTGKPYPAYKPSGVQWLGDVPAHWDITRIKQCAHAISKGTTPSTEGRNTSEFGQVRFLKAENITSGEISDKPLLYIDEDTNNLLRRSQLQEGDVLFVIAGATLGKTAVVLQELLPANTNQAVAFIRPHKQIDSSYLAYWLKSPRVKELTWLNAVQSAQPNLSMTDLGNFLFPRSPGPEQAAIVSYIDKATTDIDTAIARARGQMELFHEYRTRLISDVVTGKLDVCEATATLSEVDPLAVQDDLDDIFDTNGEPDLDEIDSTLEEAEV